MDQFRFAGYRVVEFPPTSRTALQEIADRLLPNATDIVGRWVDLQFTAWQPPGYNRDQLMELFGNLLNSLLHGMQQGELEDCITKLEDTGASLARSGFPYEALMITLHFLEESYMPFLLNPRSERAQEWLIRMDEFLHVGIAALATSYFEFQREELIEDANVGHLIQEALFPHPPKRIFDMELGFVYASASERTRLGGDFLDVFSLTSGETAFVVGDLSGHGLDAAAGSTAIRNLFRGFLHEGSNLIDAIERLNRVLPLVLESFQFATALAGTYSKDGCLTLVNAGGPPPIVCGNACRTIEQFNLPMAIDPNVIYTSTNIDLSPGDVFVTYTDGLSEARIGGELFGETRILSVIEEMRNAPVRAIAEGLKDRAIRHAGGRLMDDMAVLVLKRIGDTQADQT